MMIRCLLVALGCLVSPVAAAQDSCPAIASTTMVTVSFPHLVADDVCSAGPVDRDRLPPDPRRDGAVLQSTTISQLASQAPGVPSVGLPRIASNFPTKPLLVPAWGTGAVPASAAPDVVGAFRLICTAGHVSADDPIVYPGQPGKSHLHQFYGNTQANASSTYESLRRSGDSTCENKLNRSAYWQPAMLNGKGSVVRPDFVTIYYKRLPANDPNCKRQGIACVGLPRGLRFIFGYDMLSDTAPTGSFVYTCVGENGQKALNPNSPDISTAIKGCPPDYQLEVRGQAPDCWNGIDLDSQNHRDHVAYGSYGDWGYLKCPSTHPYIIPAFTIASFYTTDASLPGWHLSSDIMPGHSMTPGSTFHADWFGAWDDETMMMWETNCINKMLNCSGGDLGNGKQMKRALDFSWKAKPRLVPAPPPN
ncbi:DUF1996 domain-containing protein [Sphingomonas sp. M1-B02]|uniref:DUF1996 domain-containing protein n=1 Tax=Sphingomonas sp. M1-B02 TaxID=3114300 RepID=UPI002240DE9A|nr:DUF1996 domain-containing protein [Sphingomonas sp. S6-11]UZK67720.1 DUF1996 domain-containing protein [Sphingomonas sp. S6-11]